MPVAVTRPHVERLRHLLAAGGDVSAILLGNPYKGDGGKFSSEDDASAIRSEAVGTEGFKARLRQIGVPEEDIDRMSNEEVAAVVAKHERRSEPRPAVDEPSPEALARMTQEERNALHKERSAKESAPHPYRRATDWKASGSGAEHPAIKERYKSSREAEKAAKELAIATGRPTETYFSRMEPAGRKYSIGYVPGKTERSRNPGETNEQYLARLIGFGAKKNLVDELDEISLALYSAGAAKHQGLLVSLDLDLEAQRALFQHSVEWRHDGGVDPKELHITLAYCGDVSEIGDVGVAQALLVVDRIARQTRPITGVLGERDRFPASEQSDGKDVIIVHAELPGLRALREEIASELDLVGVPPRGDFDYVPHLTLAYVEPGAPEPFGAQSDVPVHFDGITVSVGDSSTLLPLRGEGDTIQSGFVEEVRQAIADEVIARADAALARLPRVTNVGDKILSVRSADVFRTPVVSLAGGMLNPKTTLNDVQTVPLAGLAPSRELIPVDGLAKYIRKPRPDPPDVVSLSGRFVVQEGHTRVAAAILRGETEMRARVWHLALDPTGAYVGTARGRHRIGLERRTTAASLSDSPHHAVVDAGPIDVRDLHCEVSLEEAKQRAFTGRQVVLKTPFKDSQTATVGEAVAIAYLKRSMKSDEVKKLGHGHFALDVLAGEYGVEVKAGLVSNSSAAQHWRLTIGEPSPDEKKFLQTAGPDEKAAHNAAKMALIFERKQKALSDVSVQVGRQLKPKTVTVILDPDRQLADVFEFDDWHPRIAWTSDQATRGFRGSYRYEVVQDLSREGYRQKLAVALGNPYRGEGGQFGSAGEGLPHGVTATPVTNERGESVTFALPEDRGLLRVRSRQSENVSLPTPKGYASVSTVRVATPGAGDGLKLYEAALTYFHGKGLTGIAANKKFQTAAARRFWKSLAKHGADVAEEGEWSLLRSIPKGTDLSDDDVAISLGKWTGVDLDGTLATFDKWRGTGVGEPITVMVDRVKTWLEDGKDVRIFTARLDCPPELRADVVAAIEDWCVEHLGQKLPVTNVKDGDMEALWDDRAVQVVKNTGEQIGDVALTHREKLAVVLDNQYRGVINLPFAEYEDFADCVAKNQDKDDPEAFCAWLKHEVEGNDTAREGPKGPPVISLPVVSDVSFPTMIGAAPAKPLKKKRKAVTWRGLRLSRRPTAFEERVLSLHDIPTRFQAETDAAVAALLALRQEQLRVFALSTSEDTQRWMACQRILQDAQERIALYGAEQVHHECAQQGVILNLSSQLRKPSFSGRQRSLLLDVAHSTALRLDAEWTASMKHAAQRLYRAKPRAKADELVDLAARRTDWGLKSAVRGTLQHAFIAGRAAEMHVLHLADDGGDLVDYVVQSAIMDVNTCDPCMVVDGSVFEFGSDEQQEYEPPYYKCEGGDACRCIQIAVVGDWRDRADVEDALDTDRVAVKTERQAERLIKERQTEDDTLD